MDAIFSPRSMAIASGLVRTGRASQQRVAFGHIQLRANRGGGFYWIPADGGRLLRGDDLEGAEELQPTFTEAMAQASRP
jgi:hypothetical protein